MWRDCTKILSIHWIPARRINWLLWEQAAGILKSYSGCWGNDLHSQNDLVQRFPELTFIPPVSRQIDDVEVESVTPENLVVSLSCSWTSFILKCLFLLPDWTLPLSTVPAAAAWCLNTSGRLEPNSTFQRRHKEAPVPHCGLSASHNLL